MQIYQRFTNPSRMMQVYSPSAQGMICSDRKRCMIGSAPTIEAVEVGFGGNVAHLWIVQQIIDLSEYCGVKEKIGTRTADMLASMILSEYKHVKLTELMLFFHDFKLAKIADRKGDVIGFYGTADPAVIAKALRQFEKKRMEEIQAYLDNMPRIEDYVEKYRQDLKNYIWHSMWSLRHECDAEEIVTMYYSDYWTYINRKTKEYRAKITKSYDERKSAWR